MVILDLRRTFSRVFVKCVFLLFLCLICTNAFGGGAFSKPGFSNVVSESADPSTGWHVRTNRGVVIQEKSAATEPHSFGLVLSGLYGRQHVSAQQEIRVPDNSCVIRFDLRCHQSGGLGGVVMILDGRVVFKADEEYLGQYRDSTSFFIEVDNELLGKKVSFQVQSQIEKGNTTVWLDRFEILDSQSFSQASSVSAPNLTPTPAYQRERSFRYLQGKFDQGYKMLRVFVELGTNSSQFPSVEEDLDEAQIQGLQGDLMGLLAANGRRPHVYFYRYLPVLLMDITEEDLAILEVSESVQMVSQERFYQHAETLNDTADSMLAVPGRQITATGRGTAVAILDSGIDHNHPDLKGRIVHQECFSDKPEWWELLWESVAEAFVGEIEDVQSLCLNKEDSQAGLNASFVEYFPNVDGIDHGTHVAGIVAGIAPDAKILNYQVFRLIKLLRPRHGVYDYRIASSDADMIKALESVHERRNRHNIVSVNMSLGESGSFSRTCDERQVFYSLFPWDEPRSLIRIIGKLTRSNVAVVVASGNDGYTNGIGPPACVTNAISVGAVDTRGGRTDVASFSNVGPNLNLFAPGVEVEAANLAYMKNNELGGGIPVTTPKDGTSMAAPHVAAVWGLVREVFPSWKVSDVLAALIATGRTVVDDRVKDGNDAPLVQVQSLFEREFPPDFRVNSITPMPLVFSADAETSEVPDSDLVDWLPFEFAVANVNEQVGGRFRVRMGTAVFEPGARWFYLSAPENEDPLLDSGILAPLGFANDHWRFKGWIAPSLLPSGVSRVELLVSHVDTDGREGSIQSFVVSVDKKDGPAVVATRRLELAVEEGSSASGSFVLRNVGDEELKWEIAEKPAWISIPVSSGSISLENIILGESGQASIGFEVETRNPGAALVNGRYSGEIRVKTNSPSNPLVRIPVVVSVRGAILVIPPRTLRVIRGTSVSVTESLVLRGADVTFSWTAESDRPWIEVVSPRGEVASQGPLSTLEYKIHSQDLGPGYHFGNIVIKAGDGDVEQSVSHQLRVLVHPPVGLIGYRNGATILNQAAADANGTAVVVGTLKNYSDEEQTLRLVSDNALIPSENFSVPGDSELEIELNLPRELEVGAYRGKLHFDFASEFAQDTSREFTVRVAGPSIDVLEGGEFLARPRVHTNRAEIHADVDFGETLFDGFSAREIVVRRGFEASHVSVTMDRPFGDGFKATLGEEASLITDEVTLLTPSESRRAITLWFEPTRLGEAEGTIRIVPAYPNGEPTVVLHMRGIGVDRPRLTLRESEVLLEHQEPRDSIVSQPSSWSGPWGSFSNGRLVRLEVEVESVPPLITGLWYRNGKALAGIDPVLTLFNPLSSSDGWYSFRAENPYGETESDSIRLSIGSQSTSPLPTRLVVEIDPDGSLLITPVAGEASDWRLEFSERLGSSSWGIAAEARELNGRWRLPIRPGDGVRFFRAVLRR